MERATREKNEVIPFIKAHRIGWIDALRALAILSIVIDHQFLIDDLLQQPLTVYEVPVFFFIAGLTFRPEKNQYSFIKKKFLRLYVPYFLVGLLSILIYGCSYSLFYPQSFGLDVLREDLIGLVYANSVIFPIRFNTPLWFLPCLFFALILFNLLSRLIKNQVVLGFIVILISCFGLDLNFYWISLPLQIESALALLFFLWFGYVMITPLQNFAKSHQWWWKVFWIAILSVAAFRLNQINLGLGKAVVKNHYFGMDYFYFYFACMCLILAASLLCQLIPKNKILECIGQHTMFILLFHRFPTIFFSMLWPVSIALLSHQDVWMRELWTIFFALVCVGMVLFADYIFYLLSRKLKNFSLYHLLN